MTSPSDLNIIYHPKSIPKNTLYNILGYGIPLIFALILIPFLIKGLGTERFGVLSLAWIVLGYASFFDFGIGKSLTKIIAEKIGLNQTNQIPIIFWTSLFIMLAISFLVAFGLSFLVPSLVKDIFKISASMQQESLDIFYVLVVSIPIVSTTAGLRGVLEAYQEFGIINVVRVFLGTFTFLGPLIVLIITDSLFWIVVFLIFIRLVVWIIYLLQCIKVNAKLKSEINSLKPVLRFSIWITVANIVGPIILYSDRFLIGSLISAAAITYYVTPYEVVTKLLLIPGSLVGVLFPVFSASFSSNPDFSKKIFLMGTKSIYLILYPVILIIVTFSYEGMKLWIGVRFAENSSIILQFLALGVLLNGLAYIPFNYLQGIGKPKIPAMVNLIELPFYLLFLFISIKQWGIKGAAFVWLSRIIIDTIILFIIANMRFKIRFGSRSSSFTFFLTLAVLVIPLFLDNFVLKLSFSIIWLVIFITVAWKFLLSVEERNFLINKLRLNVSSN